MNYLFYITILVFFLNSNSSLFNNINKILNIFKRPAIGLTDIYKLYIK